MTKALSFAIALVVATGVAEAAPRSTFQMHLPVVHPLSAQADTNVIYMNNCMPSGCSVKVGNTDNRTNTSDLGTQNGVLSAWSYGTQAWTDTMTCMKATFSRFNVVVTDVAPTGAHYEVMVAGSAAQIMGSQGQGVGGIADFPCQGTGQCDPYTPNALVFAFAAEFGSDPLEICAVAAQEIAHTWALDHVVDATDPLTYNDYTGMREYHDNEKCGSDCQGGQSPFGLTCSGSGGQASHTCSGTGTSTQNEVATMLALFGAATGSTGGGTPSVSITSPSDGASVSPGFQVTASVSESGGSIAKAELYIDGSLAGTVTAAPYAWSTSSSLAAGSHTVKVTGYDTSNATADASITVTVGGAGNPSDPGNPSNPGNPGTPGNPTNPGGTDGGVDVGGCSTTGSGAATPMLLGLLGLALINRRRR